MIDIRIIRRTIIFLTASLVFGASVAARGQHTIPSDLRFTLERSICFGTCPDYKLTISGDGNVVFEGREFVKVKGTSKAQISPDDVQKLIDAFDGVSYFSLKDKYVGGDDCRDYTTDMPTAVTSIRLNGRSKSVTHYYGYGCDAKDIRALTDLEGKIDQIVGTKRWLD